MRVVEGFFGRIMRERIRRRDLTLTEAWSDVFDYIERPHPRMQREIEVRGRSFTALTQQSAKTG